MRAYPAVDVRGGRAVQLVGGVPGSDREVRDDPVGSALHWVSAGFRALHVVDLDAALGHGANNVVIERIVRESGVPVQVGGGIRTTAAVRAWFEAGAARVMVGTRAVDEPAWLQEIASAWPERVLVAVDVRDGRVLTRGWTAASALAPAAFLDRIAGFRLAGVLVTDVSREGRVAGIDASLFESITRATSLPVIAAGGVSSLADMRVLASAGAAGAVLGMALYTGAVDARALAQEFGG